MPSPSILNLCSFHPRWKRNLAGWWVPRNWKKALPAKRSSMFCQDFATLSYAPSKLSLVAEVVSTRNVTQPYSPVARWMSEVDVAFMRANSMETWTKPLPLQEFPAKALLYGVGITNKRQGGCARVMKPERSGRKLMRRPIALRGDTKFLRPHMLGAIVHPFVQDVPGPQVAGVSQLLQQSTRQPLRIIHWECSCLPRTV